MNPMEHSAAAAPHGGERMAERKRAGKVGPKGEVVYRWCGEHNHVEKGRRLADGRVTVTAPPQLAKAHAIDRLGQP